MESASRETLSPDEDVVALAMRDPELALVTVVAALGRPEGGDEVTLRRAKGLAHRRLQQLGESEAELAIAVERARELNQTTGQGLASTSLAVTWLYQGRTPEAIDRLQATLGMLKGLDLAEARMQLGTALMIAGEIEDAISEFDKAIPVMVETEAHDLLGTALQNRGILKYHTHEYTAALTDMRAAADIHRAQGDAFSLAETKNNTALVHCRLGELPLALTLLDSVRDELTQLGVPEAAVLNDRVEVLLACGYFEDALACAKAASSFFRQNGNLTELAVIATLGMDAALAMGSPELAASLSAAVMTDEVREGVARPLVARCELRTIQTKLALAQVTPDDLAAILELADVLKGTRFKLSWLEAVLVAAELHDQQETPADALRLLEQHQNAFRGAPLALQVQRWDHIARLRQRSERTRGASAAARAGLRAMDDLLRSAGSYEIRTHATRHGESLLQTAIALHRHREPTRIRSLVEQFRAGPLRWGLPTMGDELARALAELRTIEARLAEGAANAGRQLPRAQRRVIELSRSRSTQVELDEDTRVGESETLVTWVEFQGDLLRICEDLNRSTVNVVGTVAEIKQLAERQLFLRRQLSRRRHMAGAMVNELGHQLHQISDQLDQLLLPTELGASVVLNPPEWCVSLSWGLLPKLMARPHVLVPALRLAQRALPTTAPTALAIGNSQLEHAPAELGAVAAAHQIATTKSDPSPQDLQRLSAHDLVHLAGHFVGHAQNPMFDAMDLGPTQLHGYDLLALEKPPSVLVAAGCSSGASVEVGTASLGFASAALAAGVTAVVVGQTTLEDGETLVASMTSLHESLAAGIRPANALAQLRRSSSSLDEEIVAAAFTVRGAL